MEEFLRFLYANEVWIYSLLGFIFLIYFRKLIIAWRGWKTTIFGLEKENAQRRLSAAITVVGLVGLMLAAQFFLITFVVPSYPQTLLLATPTLDLLTTPTATLNVLDVQVRTGSEGQNFAETAESNGCIPGQLEWVVPQEGETVSGAITLQGTVNIAAMGFYKYEFTSAGSQNWVTIAAGNEVKIESELGGSWNTANLVPGDYTLRLMVMDNLNNPLPACEITVRVVGEE